MVEELTQNVGDKGKKNFGAQKAQQTSHNSAQDTETILGEIAAKLQVSALFLN